MTASLEPDDRPAKRARLDSDPSTASLAPSSHQTDVAYASTLQISNAPTTPIAPAWTGDSDLDREIRAGITEYVSPDNLGFTGTLKQRYTDFLVNEILPSGEVLRLKSIGRPNKVTSQNVTKKEKVGNSVKQEEVVNSRVPENGVFIKAEPGEETIKKEEEEDRGEGAKEVVFKIEDGDYETLHSLFGEETTSSIVTLVENIQKHPSWKAKDFTAITGPPITDKDQRTLAHQTLRRVFSGLVESAMEPDQSIRIKASPPAERGHKRKKGNKRDRDADSHRGQLAWEELGGEYLHFTLYKENKDTMEVVGFLGSVTGGGPKSYSFAGTKDRRACTVQRACVKRQTAERMAGINKTLRNAAIGDFEYKHKDIRLGDLAGNEFTITLRDAHFENEQGLDYAQRLELANSVLTQAVKDFGEKGFINYYGLQRFGSFSASTDAVGIKLLQDNPKGAVEDLLAYSEQALAAADSTEKEPSILVSLDDRLRAKGLHLWKSNNNGNEALNMIPRKFSAERNIIQHLSSKNKNTNRRDRANDYQGALMTIPRNLRLMYVHAYQSLVWNVVAGKRWSLYGDKVVEGDLVLVNEHKDKVGCDKTIEQDTIDQDGEIIINPAGADSALKDDDVFERARPLTKAEAESGQYNIFDIVLPQPGFDVEYPRNAIGDFYVEFMRSERGGGLDPYNMRRSWKEVSLSGGYRKFLAKPLEPISFEIKEYRQPEEQLVETDLQRIQQNNGNAQARAACKVKLEVDGEPMDVKLERHENGEVIDQEDKKIALTLKLQLGSSQYATIALRELMKPGGVKAFKPEYMGGR